MDISNMFKTLKSILKKKQNYYSRFSEHEKLIDEYINAIKCLFSSERLKHFVFEPFLPLFSGKSADPEGGINSCITQTALVNAVIAGLPGKLGVGVLVSMGFEAWMALTIARETGIRVQGVSSIYKYFGVIAGVLVTVLFFFRHILGFFFSIFSALPLLPAMAMSEYAATCLVGVLFLTGFRELNEHGSFRIPSRLYTGIVKRTRHLLLHQKDILKSVITVENIRTTGERLKSWLNGDLAVTDSIIRGEAFAFTAMAYLIRGEFDSMQGPLGSTFIESIRRAYPEKLGTATPGEMSNFFSQRTPEQLNGDVSLVKGEMFEHLVEEYENSDSDNWTADLHPDRTEPGSDIVFTHSGTGEDITVSLKCTDNPVLIEHALAKYPDIPIITTQEMADHLGDNPCVGFSTMSSSELEQVTRDNFDILCTRLTPVDAASVVSAGAAAGAAARLWPFVMARIRKVITGEQLTQALRKVLGDAGISLASRLSYAAVLGPVFAWFMLARSVAVMSRSAENMGARARVMSEA